MTGFGKGVEKSPHGKFSVEIKSLNHKTLSITCNPLGEIFFIEEKIKKSIEKNLFRGKVFLRISREMSSDGKKKNRNIRINEPLAKDYLNKITLVANLNK